MDNPTLLYDLIIYLLCPYKRSELLKLTLTSSSITVYNPSLYLKFLKCMLFFIHDFCCMQSLFQN